jgi:hypothetical protein
VPFEGPQTNPGNNQVSNTAVSTLPHPLFSPRANPTPSELNNIIPTLLDQETQQKGLELQKVLQLFKQSTSGPLSNALFQTPQSKIIKSKEQSQQSVEQEPCQRKKQKQSKNIIVQEQIQRKSPRLQEKNREGKTITKLAHDLMEKMSYNQ